MAVATQTASQPTLAQVSCGRLSSHKHQPPPPRRVQSSAEPVKIWGREAYAREQQQQQPLRSGVQPRSRPMIDKPTKSTPALVDRQVKRSVTPTDVIINASTVMPAFRSPAATTTVPINSTTTRLPPPPVTATGSRLTAVTNEQRTIASPVATETATSMSKSVSTGGLDLLRLLETVGSPRLASMSAPVSPQTALREATRREQQRMRSTRTTSALSAASESADEDHLTVKVLGIGRNLAVTTRGGFSSTSESEAVQSLFVRVASSPTLLVSMPAVAAADDNNATSSSTNSSTRRSVSVSHPMLCALMLQLYMCSALLSTRGEMAFVEKKRLVVELGHGETRAFVGLASA